MVRENQSQGVPVESSWEASLGVGFSVVAFLTLGAGLFFVMGPVLCIAEGLASSLDSTRCMGAAYSPRVVMTKKDLQTHQVSSGGR